MLPKRHLLFLIAGSGLLLAACTQSSSEDAKSSSTKAGQVQAKASAVNDQCKNYPVPIYPSHMSLSCEAGAGPPLRQTAYIDSADSVEKVTAYYKTQVQSSGWTVDPMEVESPTRAVVSMKKGKGYATAVINSGANGSGSRIQIHAYPNGNN